MAREEAREMIVGSLTTPTGPAAQLGPLWLLDIAVSKATSTLFGRGHGTLLGIVVLRRNLPGDGAHVDQLVLGDPLHVLARRAEKLGGVAGLRQHHAQSCRAPLA